MDVKCHLPHPCIWNHVGIIFLQEKLTIGMITGLMIILYSIFLIPDVRLRMPKLGKEVHSYKQLKFDTYTKAAVPLPSLYEKKFKSPVIYTSKYQFLLIDLFDPRLVQSNYHRGRHRKFVRIHFSRMVFQGFQLHSFLAILKCHNSSLL